ncbi:Hint domain-containing protein [Shimia sp. SDUM112013]|uniref:Hint domain-containing protein n=1 Tax=Shimia sp. SDUM112013 TaxID=3136160 RepID=UPI0032F04364
MIIDGVEMSFTVNFSGALPQSNKLRNVNGEDLRGERIVVITTEDGQRLFFLPDGISLATMEDFPNWAHSLVSFTTTLNVPVCFVEGAGILTPSGERPVETLAIGDTVTTFEGDTRTIRWIAKRHLTFSELLIEQRFRPVRIAKGVLGRGLPARDLWLSPQHRVLFAGWEAELLFRNAEVFVPAISFADLEGQGAADIVCGVTYYHLLLERHEVLVANGLPCESLFPGDAAIAAMDAEAREDLKQRFPEFRQGWAGFGDTARQSLTRREGELLLAYAGIGGVKSSETKVPVSLAA